MASLEAAIDKTPIIDNHAHPLLKSQYLGKYPLLSIATEAHGDALDDSRFSLAHIRATKQLAEMLGCDATWEAVESAIQKQRAKDGNAWTKRCMKGIETLLLDDGLDGGNEVHGYAEHDRFVPSKCKRIVRIEAVATQIIQSHIASDFATRSYREKSGLPLVLDNIVEEFQKEIGRSIADPEVVGFKSIICYRGGLDIPRMENVSEQDAYAELQGIIEAYVVEKTHFKRLQHLSLNHLLVHTTARLIKDSKSLHKKPIQFHTGLGDNDITLAKSSPSHLQNFIKEYSTVPIVILHASYPWTREAGYLAAMYKNVYADIGEVFPFVSRHGQEAIVRQILELCPWPKILWSTDGHWFPETYILATTQIRSVLKTVLRDLVHKKQLSESQAVQLVQDILFTNSKKLYNLQLDTTLPSTSQLAPATTLPGTAWPPEVVLEKLQHLDCKWLRIYWHDYTSSARCRLIPMKRVLSTLEKGKPVTQSTTKAGLGLLPMDMMIPEITATGAYMNYPDWSSLKLGPAPGHVSVYCEFREQDGSDVDLCPRTLLRKTLERAAEHGLSFLMGFELEFVLMERNPDRDSPDQYVTMRNDGHAWAQARAMADMGREGSVTTMLDEVADLLDQAGIDMEQMHPENAPGQYEIVLPAMPPMEACDALLHTRQIIEATAARHNYRMTLHPKPFTMACGSASHVHMSVSSPGGNTPEVYESFYAGIMNHYRALIAFTYPHPTSYERMVDSFWAGGRWVSWGTQNKEAPLRKCEDGHWELKTIDGIANPFFAISAILSAGTHGILQKEPLKWGDCDIDPAKLTPEKRKKLGIDTMFPADLKEALAALKEDKVMVELLGSQFVERYVNVKNAEMRLLDPMTDEERRRWVLERY